MLTFTFIFLRYISFEDVGNLTTQSWLDEQSELIERCKHKKLITEQEVQ